MRDIKFIKQMLSQVSKGITVENTKVDKLMLDQEEVIALKEYIEQLEAKANKYDGLEGNLNNNIEVLETVWDNYIDANVLEGSYEISGRISEDRRILKLLKGE